MRKLLIFVVLAISFLVAGKLDDVEFAEDQPNYQQQQLNTPASITRPKSKLDLFEESIQILECDSLDGTYRHLEYIIKDSKESIEEIEQSKKTKRRKRKRIIKLIEKKISFYEEALEIVGDILDEECDEDEEK